ncbi:hypothetical protein JK386_12770 [Nocardioides sp. zg-536]|uniref:Uncharacterized protein n=1 Tax=Nocardioides faecalis TaxID=2803858 RepID=A0A938YB47_9ACTN|nr:hypothetical protein [Nocardioides faecalis]MBM9460776.1 hypothetical protein [Nocardioides faecalis]MBS4752715.1 hypothetical protein [Nocardioides faecalis]QVI57969.1 hypothetical protein KG111_13145 [Nocardioides faecalis]
MAPQRAVRNVEVRIDEDSTVLGLLLKTSSAGDRVMVTYEHDGRVVTSWLPSASVRHADPEPV